ncbi:MAG: EamA family transporter, partial [Anaerolineae bacterium]|nr:EamA family transporter [Anaerolineae bacterium]
MGQQSRQINTGGIIAALSTPLFLGVAPIFGKMAVQFADPFTVAALRTMLAVSLLWIVFLLFARRYIFIYPAGLMGCVVIGVINGIGSLFYYGGLHQLDNASLAQLINGMYLVFALMIAGF